MKRLMMTKGNYKYIFKQITSLLISICIIGQSSSTFAMQTPKQQRAEFIDYLKVEQDRYKTLFDQEALLDVLDYDTDKIIDFVSNKVVYQAYDGVLRGAKGTLVGRAGNSHDQAITLAGMLNDAGLEAEILVGKLTEEQASELNLTIASPQFSELKDTISSSKSILAKKISAKAKELVKTEGESISTLMEETDALAKRIYQQLPEEQIKKGMEAFKQAVQSSAISYRWVRYRLAQGKKWIEVHPAYTGAKKWRLTPESFEKKNVNPEDLQQFSVEVWIENSVGEKHSITGLWKKPAANLLDHTLSIEIGSDAMLKPDLLNKQDEMIKQSHFFFVKVDGKSPKDGKVFDLNGNIYSGNALSGLNSVFSTLNKKSQKAASALSSLSFDENKLDNNKKQLTKVWLEFTLDKPTTESRIIKRVIFDGNALNDKNKTVVRLLQHWGVGIATTKPMQQYYQNNKSKEIIAAMKGADKFQEYLRNKSNANQKEAIEKYGLAIGNPNRGLLSYKRSIFDRYESMKKNVSYLYEPNILAIRRGLNQSDTRINFYELTDIVSNQRWSFKNQLDNIIPSPINSLKHGVWETKTELVNTINGQNVTRFDSSYEQLSETKNYKKKFYSQSLDLNLYNESGLAWWEIDLHTGSTAGMVKLEQGIGGGVFTEYITKNITITGYLISLAYASAGTYTCKAAGGDFTCCLSVNLAIMGVGLALSWSAGIIGLALLGTEISAGAAITIGVVGDISLAFGAPVNCKKT